MGCCFSSTFNPNTAATETNPKRHHSPLQPPILQSQKTPSPPYDDEEAAVIKEVMVVSETPKVQEDQQDKITQTPLPLPALPLTPTAQAGVEEQQEHEEQEQETSHLSQQSEIYAISETVSTTTTATEGLKEDEATSKVKHKSPTKVIKKRPTNGGDSGSFRAPEKRAHGHGRGRGSGAMRRTVQRNVGSRSKSPGNERAGRVSKDTIGRSTTTVTGKTDSKPIGSASERSEGQSKREEDGNHEVAEQQQQQQRTESLENPLVSLECFIFL